MNALEKALSISPGIRRMLVSETGPGRLLRRGWYVGRQQCNLCGSWVRFRESWIGAQLIAYGFPYAIDDFETLNHDPTSVRSVGQTIGIASTSSTSTASYTCWHPESA